MHNLWSAIVGQVDNSLLYFKILDSSELKELADDKPNLA